MQGYDSKRGNAFAFWQVEDSGEILVLKIQMFKWKEEEIESKVQKIAKAFKMLIRKKSTPLKILRHFAEMLANY